MPPPETTARTQRIVVWPVTGSDAYGQETVGDPYELTVRWDDTQTKSMDKDGNTVLLDATIGSLTQAIAPGSAVWQGGLDDLPGTALVPESNVYYVKTSKGVPDIKGRMSFRTCGLVRGKDSLPNEG